MQQDPAPIPCHWANLLWACSTPSVTSDPRLPWLPARRLAALDDFFRTQASRRRLEERLDAAMAASTSTRLGVYFEDLWSFIFQHHPDYQLVARNLPLRSGNRTLGELDFVVRHLPSGGTEHWELAVKFYLQVAGRYWVGPALRDRLDIKLARMAGHQLPVALRTETLPLLEDRGIHIDRQWALMPGRLFRPLGSDSIPLDQSLTPVNPGRCRYWWATPDEFMRHFQHFSWQWCRLPKRAWLAEHGYRAPHRYSCATLASQLSGDSAAGPACVAALDGTGEVSRGFLIPPGWPRAAVESL